MVVPAQLERLVRERAQDRCEYCRLAQAGQEATFHIDHVIPIASGGKTSFENLALACVSCSLRKGARETALDAKNGNQVPLFNPRSDTWEMHFRWDGVRVVGQTPTGRATIALLRLNRPLILAIRREEQFRKRHPPPAS